MEDCHHLLVFEGYCFGGNLNFSLLLALLLFCFGGAFPDSSTAMVFFPLV